jgi:phosphoglycerol transferase
MEHTFMNEEYDLMLAKNLHNIANNNISFKNQRQIYGATFTIGGLTAQLFGLPLKTAISYNQYGVYSEKFLPSAVSILDILSNNNYNFSVILGSTSLFSGLDNLFMTHTEKTEIYDKNTFLKSKENKKFYDKLGWGFNDKFVYEQAKIIISELSQAQEPFFAMVMTIDTHTPGKVYGHYPAVFGDARDSFVEADLLAADFLDWLKQQPFYKDTIVVIVGDHEFMSEKVGSSPIPSEMQRTIFNAFINTDLDPSALDLNRPCTTLDLAPTILEALGFTLPQRQFGLGTSLFSDQPTLRESYGENFLNEELAKKSPLYDSFYFD